MSPSVSWCAHLSRDVHPLQNCGSVSGRTVFLEFFMNYSHFFIGVFESRVSDELSIVPNRSTKTQGNLDIGPCQGHQEAVGSRPALPFWGLSLPLHTYPLWRSKYRHGEASGQDLATYAPGLRAREGPLQAQGPGEAAPPHRSCVPKQGRNLVLAGTKARRPGRKLQSVVVGY